MSIKNTLHRSYSSTKGFLHSLTYSPIRYTVTAIVVFYVNILYWEIYRSNYYRADFPFLLIAFLIVGLIIVLFRAFRRYQLHREEIVANESAQTTCNSPALKSLLLSLRRRALGLRLVSWFILGLTFTSIIAGLYLFTAAGQIALEDSLVHQFEREVRDRENRHVDAINALTEAIDNSQDPNKVILRGQVEQLRADIENSTVKYRETLQKLEQTYGSNERFWLFLSASSTRVGSILMLIFLVQILLSVYRYSIRMVSYYEARADALLLYGGDDPTQLQSLVTTLSADKVEFGKAPSSPADQAIELIKSVEALRK